MALQESPPPMDEKAKRTRDLLASFYAPDPSTSAASTPSKRATLDSINTPGFDPENYMDLLVRRSNLEGLIQRHVQMAAEIKNLDTDLQMLVYENYNKFISATDTIKRMKNNILGMEANMEELLEKIVTVQSKSDGVNTSLFQKRENIEKLHRTGNLLRKIQFIYDLPSRLGKCIKSEAYADAVRFFIGAKPIFELYGESSFHDCKKASEDAMEIVIKNLQAKLYSDSEPIEERAEAVVLLKQLNYPVDNLKSKLLERLEGFLSKYQSEAPGLNSTEPSTFVSDHSHLSSSGSLDSIDEFSKSVRAYQIIFPESERRLIELTQGLVSRRFHDMQQCMTKRMSSMELLSILSNIWADMTVMDEVLPDAALPVLSFEATRDVIQLYISRMFSFLMFEIIGALIGNSDKSKGDAEELKGLLERCKKAVIQGAMDLLLDFRHLLDENLAELKKLKDLIIDWVQEGFQDFFKALNIRFLSISGKTNSVSHDDVPAEKVPLGTVLVLVQLSLFVEQSAIPRITEEVAASFSGGSVGCREYGPAFVPGEICRLFRTAAEKLLDLYINLKTQKISVLLKKRFMTPNWVKHKEPREIHMFVDLLIQELDAIINELKQTLPRGTIQKHQQSESAGSTNSSKSNHMREDKISRSMSQKARSQLLESHLARLFEQKMEIFTKVEFTQESVLSTIVKLCLKSLQEFIRLQTFNRSGYQQIQLDMEFLKTPLKEIAGDEAAIDFLFKEVNNAAQERCLDPISLEPAIVDKLIQAKQAKHKDLSSIQ